MAELKTKQNDQSVEAFLNRVEEDLYIMSGFQEYDELLMRLGKHKTGKACLYINKVADIDLPTLKELVRQSTEHIRNTTP